MTTTELITVLRKMQVLGPVSQAWTNEAANRLHDLQLELDGTRAEVEQLKQALHDARLENSGQAARIERTRPEPSRLEIAAMIYAGIDCDDIGCAFDAADELIAAAKEGR